jgi:hypothetical protein
MPWALATAACAVLGTITLGGCPFATHGEETNGTGASGSTSSSHGSGGASSTSGSVAHSASASTGGCATGTTEICDDGIDNNCDGMVDCEDPLCQAANYACAPAAPSGWTVVDFTPDTTPACSTGYGNAEMLSPAPTSPDMCTCACGAPQKNPCAQGVFIVTFGFSQCGGPPVPLTSDGTCNPVGAMGATIGTGNGTPWSDAKAKPLGATMVACDTTTTLPAVTPGVAGRSCAPTSPAGKGCPNSGACLPTVPAAAWCIRTDGDVPCPSPSFTQRHVVSDPTDVMDGRACGACTCTSNATSCSNASFTTYNNAACTGGSGVTATADSGCHDFMVGGNNSGDSYFKYSATANTLACSGGGSVGLTGAVTLKNPKTICCP